MVVTAAMMMMIVTMNNYYMIAGKCVVEIWLLCWIFMIVGKKGIEGVEGSGEASSSCKG